MLDGIACLLRYPIAPKFEMLLLPSPPFPNCKDWFSLAKARVKTLWHTAFEFAMSLMRLFYRTHSE